MGQHCICQLTKESFDLWIKGNLRVFQKHTKQAEINGVFFRCIYYISSIFSQHKSKNFVSQSLIPILTLLNKIFISADFEQKKFGRFFRFFVDFQPNFVCSKSVEVKILLFKGGMGTKLYDTKFFDLCCGKIELML